MTAVADFTTLLKGRKKPEGSVSPSGKYVKRQGKWVPTKRPPPEARIGNYSEGEAAFVRGLERALNRSMANRDPATAREAVPKKTRMITDEDYSIKVSRNDNDDVKFDIGSDFFPEDLAERIGMNSVPITIGYQSAVLLSRQLASVIEMMDDSSDEVLFPG